MSNLPNHPEAGVIDSLPPVKIDVFCTKSQEAVKKIVADRRTARANISLFDGSGEDTIDYYAERSSPDLLIVEIPGDGDEIVFILDQLAAVCTAETKVIIIGEVNDINTYRRVIDLGVSDYLAHPIGAVQLLSSIAAIFGSSHGESKHLGRTIAFIGARGGAGSSTVAHNLSWHIARLTQRKVLLADFDFAFGTLALACNLDAAPGSYDLIASKDRLDEKLFERLCIKYDETMSVLLAPSTPDRDYPDQPELYTNLVQLARRMSAIFAIDLPHIWTPWKKAVLLEADDIVITATPDLASLRNCKTMLDVLRGHRENDRKPFLLLNQTGTVKTQISSSDYEKLLGIEPIIDIPFDAASFSNAATTGMRLVEVSPRLRSSIGFETAAKIITGVQQSSSTKKSGMSLSSLMSGSIMSSLKGGR